MNNLSPPLDARARLRQLVPYYAGCLKAEANRGATALTGEVSPRWFEPPQADWHAQGMEPRRWAADTLPARFLARASGQPIFYGYPLLGLHGDRGPQTWIPAVLCPIELRLDAARPDHGEELCASRTKDPPMINADFLGAIAKTPEERQQATRALRETLADDPALTHLAEQLRRRAGLHCELHPRGLVLAGTASAFTGGLEGELERLGVRSPELERTALGALLGASGTQAEPLEVVEAVSLDDAQRAVVREATEHALTVATGPAGTGKTQVVAAALSTVLCAGGSVLFASRNHQTVNLLEARMAELVGRPVLMRAGVRTGRRDLRQGMIEALKALLSGASRGAPAALQDAREHYRRAWRRRAALWNKIDRLAERLEAGQRVERVPPLTRARLQALAVDAGELAAAHWLVRRLRAWFDRPLRRRWQDVSAALDAVAQLTDPPPPLSPIAAPHEWCRYLNRILRVEALPSRPRHRPGDLATDFAQSVSGLDAEVVEAGRAWVDAHLQERASALPGPLRADLGAYRAALEQAADGTAATLKSALAGQFARLLPALPLWSVTHLSAHNTVPLEPGLFDLAILDEASQSDIPSALPLLYRSKRALIIGDAKQLRHVATLRGSADRHLREVHGLTQLEDQPFGFSHNSLFDLALTALAARVHFLDGHYRAHRDLVEFSNQQWYGGRLQVRTDYGRLQTAPVEAPLSWVPVTSAAAPARGGGVVVAREVTGVAEQLHALQRSGYRGTVGVVAPFRAQVARLRRAIARLDPRWVAERRLIASTAHGFQGDERDLIIISLCVVESLPQGARRFLAQNGHLLNVALTRARSTCVLLGDIDACAGSGISHYEALATHAMRSGAVRAAVDGETILGACGAPPREATAAGPDEQSLMDALRADGLEAVGQYPVDQYVVDLLVSDGRGEILVEVDGLTIHTRPSGHRLRQDLLRDSRLRARGWAVLRLWAHQVREDPRQCVMRIRAALRSVGSSAAAGPDPAFGHGPAFVAPGTEAGEDDCGALSVPAVPAGSLASRS